LSVLLAYLFSMLITGLIAYISAFTFDIPTSDTKGLSLSVYASILVFFLVFYSYSRLNHFTKIHNENFVYYQPLVNAFRTFFQFLKKRIYEVVVFGSLFSLIIISTYYLYGGTTIGDQWFHQGRALLFISGSFKEAALSNADSYYLPFQSALLASLSTLSGMPVVNSYVSIAFINIFQIFAFYYLFINWVPAKKRKAALLACALYTISGGFGWIYLLNATVTNPIISPHSSLETLRGMGPVDIVSSSNFVMTTAPQFTTGLTYIGLPAGFVLLGMIGSRFSTRPTYTVIVTAIAVLGMVTHDEFYIFIIIASLLPIIFRLQHSNYLYIGLSIAFLIVYIMNITGPIRFYTSNEILGFPLLLLSLLFVLLTWTVYLSVAFRIKIPTAIFVFLSKAKKIRTNNLKLKLLTKISIVSIIAYVYLLSFIVLGHLPTETITDQTRENTIPWYLFYMRMGTIGLAGMAFILSYLFRKFEKKLFVFGVLIVVAFITGPYYDEHRFTKYIMVGMIGFASVMIYDILTRGFNNNKKPLVNSLLVGLVITTSAMSILAYIGYNSLIFQTGDYIDTLARRHFPPMSQIHFFEILRDKIDIDSKKYNVISFLSQYNRLLDGLMPKIPAFSGLPNDKLRQNPLTLNATTLDSLYHSLDYTDTRYIIIPKESITKTSISEPVRFVLEHFNHIYEDDNYILIEVPFLAPPIPSSRAEVGLIYNEPEDLVPLDISSTVLLPFDNKTFDLDNREISVTPQKNSLNQVLKLLGTKIDRGITVWSKNLPSEKRVNFIETSFQIMSGDENKSNDVRVEWIEADNQNYYAKLSNDGLELYQKSNDNQSKKILLKNTEVERKNEVRYTLTIRSTDDSIKIYLNHVLKIQFLKKGDNSAEAISKIGLTTYYNDVIFISTKIGTVADYYKINEGSKYYDYYYPLTILASSNSRYDIFSNNDTSVFSKKAIVLPDTLIHDNATLSRYIDYAREGGTLIIVNSQNNLSTDLEDLFSLKSSISKQEAFTKIVMDNNQENLLNVSGLVNRVNIQSLPNSYVIASYHNNKNESIAPFIIQENFTNGGNIILLNSRGYFNSISNSSSQYFNTLAKVAELLPIDIESYTTTQNTWMPPNAFVGKLQVSGKVTLNSSALLLPDEGSDAFPINTSRIKIFNGRNNVPVLYSNASINEIRFTGDYDLKINFTGKSELPGDMSYRDYIGMQVPSGFNMSVQLAPKSSGQIELVNQDSTSTDPINLGNISKIEFYKMKPSTSLNSLSVLVKKPEIKFNGHVYIKKAYLERYGFISELGRLNTGIPLDLKGDLAASFAYVDNFDQPFRNATKTQYITYLDWITMNGSITQDKVNPRLPGDIYFKAKEQIPLVEILSSPVNGIAIIGCFIVAFVVAIKLTRKQYASTA
jgi:hypothetical protein